jgi:hypothetical protein
MRSARRLDEATDGVDVTQADVLGEVALEHHVEQSRFDMPRTAL